eukprot:scaffold1086_cov121-Amphora_coffeaeformis.AAC.3
MGQPNAAAASIVNTSLNVVNTANKLWTGVQRESAHILPEPARKDEKAKAQKKLPYIKTPLVEFIRAVRLGSQTSKLYSVL